MSLSSKFSWANVAQETVVGPIGLAEWLRLEGCSQSVGTVLATASEILSQDDGPGVTSRALGPLPVTAYYAAADDDDLVRRLETLLAGIYAGEIAIDWASCPVATAQLLRRALSVMHPWPTQKPDPDWVPATGAPGYSAVRGGIYPFRVPDRARTPDLARKIRAWATGWAYRRDPEDAAALAACPYTPEHMRPILRRAAGLWGPAQRRRHNRRPQIVGWDRVTDVLPAMKYLPRERGELLRFLRRQMLYEYRSRYSASVASRERGTYQIHERSSWMPGRGIVVISIRSRMRRGRITIEEVLCQQKK
ncbi:MAG: hypothetical protein ACE5HE_00265 [Phycisphaerae bacterium]